MKNEGDIVSDVPPHFLKGKTDDEKWMYEQQSIQRQLLERVGERLTEGDRRFDQADKDRKQIIADLEKFSTRCQAEDLALSKRLEPFERIKKALSRKWTFILGTVLGPILALVAGEALWEWIKHFFRKP